MKQIIINEYKNADFASLLTEHKKHSVYLGNGLWFSFSD